MTPPVTSPATPALTRPPCRWVGAPEDRGQTTVLLLGFALVAFLLVAVVVDTSRVFLGQRALANAADGAAVAAAGGVEASVVYAGALGEDLPLSQASAEQAVASYVAAAGLAGRFDDFAVESVSTDGATVTVVLRASVALPLGQAAPQWRDGYPLVVQASAQAPLLP